MNVLNYVTHELLSPSYRRFPQSKHWNVLKVVASLGDACRVSSRITGLPELCCLLQRVYALNIRCKMHGLKFYCLHLTFEVDFRKQHCLWNIFQAHYSWKHVEIPAPEINLCFTPRPPVAGENFPCVQVWVKSCLAVVTYCPIRIGKARAILITFCLSVTSCTWKLFVWKKKRRLRNKQTKQNK